MTLMNIKKRPIENDEALFFISSGKAFKNPRLR